MQARGVVTSWLFWLIWSSGLLAIGFLLTVWVASLIAGRQMDPDEVGGVQRALTVYARVVLLKGLLPQLALTLVLYGVCDRFLRLSERGHAPVLLALAGSAAIAAMFVFPLLLTTNAGGMPAVKSSSWVHTLRTCTEMTAAVVAAAAAPLLLKRHRAGRRDRRVSPIPMAR